MDTITEVIDWRLMSRMISEKSYVGMVNGNVYSYLYYLGEDTWKLSIPRFGIEVKQSNQQHLKDLAEQHLQRSSQL